MDGPIIPNARVTVQDTEELAFRLLESLPRMNLAIIQKRIASLLQFDIVGQLPTELALAIFSHLPFQTLLNCGLVNHRWRTLADDQSLWKELCNGRGWEWKDSSSSRSTGTDEDDDDSDDEGMGDSADDNEDPADVVKPPRSSAAAAAVPAVAKVSPAMKRSISAPYVALGSSSSCAGPAMHTTSSSLKAVRRSSSSGANKGLSVSTTITTSSRFQSHYNGFNKRIVPFLPTTIPIPLKPNYKLLHQTRIKLRNRISTSSYRLSTLQTRGSPSNAHSNTIYCLQLYTYAESGKQVLFTGSRDKTVREWNLGTGMVERVVEDVHLSSILTICVYGGYLASAGSDRRVVLWDLGEDRLKRDICDHEDSVLCVRFNDVKLVSCSKDRTVRIYSFPDLQSQFVLNAHSAAVNSVAIFGSFVVSASGDRSIRLWDANDGTLLRTFDNHHTRGIASVDLSPPAVVSGSSDKHVRYFDMTTLQGWSTVPKDEAPAASSHVLPFSFPSCSVSDDSGPVANDNSPNYLNGQQRDGTSSSSSSSSPPPPPLACRDCGSTRIENRILQMNIRQPGSRCAHGDLVRTVAFREDFVLSGSYDSSIKIWDRRTGVLVADLAGGHTGKIFCIGFDSKKIVSCGDDHRICIWDFSYGIDTRFLA